MMTLTAGQEGCQARDRCSSLCLTFVSVRPLDMFDETTGHFAAVIAATKMMTRFIYDKT